MPLTLSQLGSVLKKDPLQDIRLMFLSRAAWLGDYVACCD